MKNERFYDLLDKYFLGSITSEEKDELLRTYHSIGLKESTYPENRERVRDKMLARLNDKILVDKKRPVVFQYWWAAAAVIIIALGTDLFLVDHSKSHPNKVATGLEKSAKIVPGTNLATLTLGNGKTILLNDAKTDTIAVQGGVVIRRNSSGRIVYETVPDNGLSVVQINTITTPVGGQIKIVLPDKSEVWLNASSSLSYPNIFREKERRVLLKGEAYFEVANKKEQPFLVCTDKTNIRVLGTHFNVMAYQNEPFIATTLLEGAVSVSSGSSATMLVPGQQGLTNRNNNQINVQKANVNDVIAWKNGYFSFRDENIRTAMNKIARWYNVDIQFQGTPSGELLGGTVSRSEDISVLLSYLQLTKIAKFKIEGRKITVIANN